MASHMEADALEEKHNPVATANQSDTENESIKAEAKDSTADDEYPTGARLAIIALALVLATFLVSLDNTILGTAIPKITDEFKDLNKVSWYGAAYFMTFGGFQSPMGKLYKYFPLKLWFLINIVIFEVGSLVCAVAQNPDTLIVGRAIAGVGGAGLSVGAFTIVAFAAPPRHRPALLGLVGMSYCLAAVMGPLIGGAFTERVSWRWCFYINLPIGGVVLFAVFFMFKTPKAAKPVDAPLREKLLQLDGVGITLVIGLIVAYLLALQYGGQTEPWDSSVVIGLLVGSVAIAVTFVLWEKYQGERAMIVGRLFKLRYTWQGAIFMFFFAGGYFVILYFLPIYFQSVYNASPIGSAVKMLAFILPMTVGVLIQGFTLSIVGIGPLFTVTGSVLATIGAGLLYTLAEDTSTGKWVGFQIIVGFATGLTFQTTMAVAQVLADPAEMSQVTASILFFSMIGGSFFLSAAQSAFNNRLIASVQSRLPNISPGLILGTGATEIREAFSEEEVPIIIDGYMEGLHSVFGLTIAAFGISFFLALLGSWKKMKMSGAAVAAV